MRAISKLIRDERGATAVEYGLICALIVVAIMGAIAALGSRTLSMWGNVADTVQTSSK